MDKYDSQIISELIKNAKQNSRQIGEKLHLSSQAVSRRRIELEKTEISKQTINTKRNAVHIEVYLNSNSFAEFENSLVDWDNIVSFEKIEGSYCYHIKYIKLNERNYRELISTIEKYARYKVQNVSRSII